MASSSPHRRSNSRKIPPEVYTPEELFNQFFSNPKRFRVSLQLQQYTKTQQIINVIKTFEEDFRGSTKGSRDAGVVGIIAAVVVGMLILLSPFNMRYSFSLAGAIVGAIGFITVLFAGFKSDKYRFEKNNQVKRLRPHIEWELKELKDKINSMGENINERTEKMRDFNKLDQNANYLLYVWIETLAFRNEPLSAIMCWIAVIAKWLGEFNLALDMISVRENTRALKDMRRLAETPIDEETDEREIRSKAGKFMVEIRKLINQLQNITDELEKTKHKPS